MAMIEFTTFSAMTKVMSPTTPNLLIKAENISLQDEKRLILQDIDLTLEAGKIVSVVGPNGAGKTSLLKVILGLIKPTNGTIWRKKDLKIGYMPQQLRVDPLFPISVKRFLMLGGNWSSDAVKSMLTEVKVLQVLNSPLYSLSGGELQRVLLARALLRKPDLLVLDEPAQGVDLVGQGEFYSLIAAIRDKHACGIFLVSHDLHVVMAKTDIVVCLNQHVCCSGNPEVVTKEPAFADLFGPVARELAFYSHHHDHQHDVHGQVISEKSGTQK